MREFLWLKRLVGKKQVRRGPPKVHGEYNRQGYEIFVDNIPVYWAGNCIQDSQQVTHDVGEMVSLKDLRKFCMIAAKDTVLDRNGKFVGIERVIEL